MKKINLIIISILLCVGVFAQEAVETTTTTTTTKSKALYSKKGEYVLPQAGDISIGVDALPVLKYMGNFFGKNASNGLNISQTNIYGRYFLSEDMAVRANIDFHRGKTTDRKYVQDDKAVTADPKSQAQLTDVMNGKDEQVTITAGVQLFRGYGRLRGFYGGFAGYGLGVKKYSFQYGNNITEMNTKPTSTNFVDPLVPSIPSVWDGDNRVLSSKLGKEHHILLGGLVGVEYYFAPKMCIGIEGHLMMDMKFAGQGTAQYETWNGKEVMTVDRALSPKQNANNIDTDFGSITGVRPSAGVYLMFSF